MSRVVERAEHGELQSRILAVVRERGETTVRDVHEALSSRRPVAYTTVLTVMSRLAERGLLDKRKVGRVGVFRISLSNDSEAAGKVVEQLLGRFGSVAVSQFVAHAQSDPALRSELRRLIEANED